MGNRGGGETGGGGREVSKEVYFHFKEHMCNNGTNILRFGAKTIFCMNFYSRLLLFFLLSTNTTQAESTNKGVN